MLFETIFACIIRLYTFSIFCIYLSQNNNICFHKYLEIDLRKQARLNKTILFIRTKNLIITKKKKKQHYHK